MKRILFFAILFFPLLAFSQTRQDSVGVKTISSLTELTANIDTSYEVIFHDPSTGKISYRASVGEFLKTINALPSVIGTSQIINATIINDDISGSAAIALSKLQNLTANRLVGRDTTGTGIPESLTVGYGLRMGTDRIDIDTVSATGLVSKSRLTNALDDVTATGGGIWEQENTNTLASNNTTDNYHQGNIGIGDFSSNTIGGTFHAYAANMQMILSDSCSTDSCATPQILLRRGYNTSNLGKIGFLSTSDPHFYFQNNIASGRLLFQTNAVTQMSLFPTGQLSLPAYGDTTFTGTAVKYLAVTDAGLVIEADGAATISALTPTGTNDSQGDAGDLAYDNSYLYVKTAAGWKRTGLSTWNVTDTISQLSPVVYIHADDISGVSDGGAISSVTDRTDNSTDFSQGTGANQPLYRATGINSKPAIDFDGTNDYLESAGVTYNNDSVTIAAVLVFDDTTGAPQVFAGKTNSTSQFFAGISSAKNLRPVASSGGTNAGYLSDTTAINSKTYIVVFSIDAVSNTADIYINGTLKATVAGNNSISSITNAASAYVLGAYNTGTPSQYFNGKLSVFAAFDKVLTTAQMLDISTFLNNQYAAY